MKRFTSQQIVEKLRQADIELGKGLTAPEVCRKIEISQQTYYRWRQKYGGMNPLCHLPLIWQHGGAIGDTSVLRTNHRILDPSDGPRHRSLLRAMAEDPSKSQVGYYALRRRTNVSSPPRPTIARDAGSGTTASI